MFRLLLVLFFASGELPAHAGAPLNILLITVDDMSADSVGCFGSHLRGTTPNIDQLGSQSLKFQFAHVQVANCYPSRNVMLSGRYPHNNRVEGFYRVNNDYPVLCDLMKQAGYHAAIRGKVSHSTPHSPYAWDEDLTITPNGKKEDMKEPDSYYRSTKQGIAHAKAAGKPFSPSSRAKPNPTVTLSSKSTTRTPGEAATRCGRSRQKITSTSGTRGRMEQTSSKPPQPAPPPTEPWSRRPRQTPPSPGASTSSTTAFRRNSTTSSPTPTVSST